MLTLLLFFKLCVCYVFMLLQSSINLNPVQNFVNLIVSVNILGSLNPVQIYVNLIVSVNRLGSTTWKYNKLQLKVSEHEQEMPQSHTADQTMAPC